jgi:predicted nucleotide-binding protein (sugar kinase/HSP70/actin superfamily)
MGNMYITVKTLFNKMGLEVIVPPPCTKKTLSIGTQYAPEFACLPLKINLGNYIEAVEMGADTIIMGGGIGPCRFGYYAQIQKEILNDLGYDLEMIVLEPPDVHFSELYEKLKKITKSSLREVLYGIYLALNKTHAVDNLEKLMHKIRPRQIRWSDADGIYENALKKIEAAENKYEVKKIYQSAKKNLLKVPQDKNKEIVHIAVVGEIYTVLEPFVNVHIEKKLGKLGVEVHRSIYLSHWINEHLLGGILPFSHAKRKNEKLARPYLNSFVGGHGRETISSAVDLSDKIDGLIQIAPLTCMPEIVAHSILPRVSKQYAMPFLTFYLDEQTGESGFQTRLEAFVDMIKRTREMVSWKHV